MRNVLQWFAGLILWLILLPIDWLATLTGYILAPILPAFASPDGWLPWWLKWFQTPDNPLDGDAGFKADHAMTPTYLRRVLWLYRNPAYGFAWTVEAAKIPVGTLCQAWGTLKVSNTSPYTPGARFVKQGRYWGLYVVYPSFPGKCLRLRMGWKLDVDGNNDNAMYVFSPNPWMNRG